MYIYIYIYICNTNNNVYSYSTSSGPSTRFTTFELLFLVSTVTLGKPLLSIKKDKTQDSFFRFICCTIGEKYASLLAFKILKPLL